MYLPLQSFVPVVDREVCSLLDGVPASAQITGQDGATSVEVDGRVFWGFNDTWVISANGTPTLIPNNFASTQDLDGADCVSLLPFTSNGIAAPSIPRLPGEIGAFPSGMVSVQEGFVHFFYASGVFDASTDLQYRIRGFGLARFDTTSGTGERLLGGQLIWNDDSFPGAHLDETLALTNGGYVYVLLRLTLGDQAGTMLARTPADQLEAAQFEYWTGSSWSGGIPDVSTPVAASKALLWVQPIGMNAPGIAYNEFLGKWVAIYTSKFANMIEARTAGALTGPWSEAPVATAIDCMDFLPPVQHTFVCYMAQQHPVYAKDGGRTIYVSWNNFTVYKAFLHELHLGAPVYEWTDGDSAQYAIGDQAVGGAERAGVAFYASDIAVGGLTAIHQWRHIDTGARRLAVSRPSDSYVDDGVAFYAPVDQGAADGLNALYAPVYRWSNGAGERYSPLDLRGEGYAAQERAFYAACPDSDLDGATDCAESFAAGDGSLDSDKDGMTDDFERSTANCDPLLWTDDQDGMPTSGEVTSGTTNPCVWDSGFWGCGNAPLRHPACDVDSDGDRCMDAWEFGSDPRFGGKRDPEDPWDYFNPTGDGRNRSDDILAVAGKYFSATGDPSYSTAYDRGAMIGPYPWDLAPPDGRVLLGDVLAISRSYMQDCP